MTENAGRRFTLADLMTLIVAVAGSLAIMRLMPSLVGQATEGKGVAILLQLAGVNLTTSLALLALRLRQPRPSFRQLWRQPGWMASVALALTLAIIVLDESLNIVYMMVRNGLEQDDLTIRLNIGILEVFENAVFCVAATWLTLAVVVGWEAEPTWIDRLGRLVGLFWLSYPTLLALVQIVT